MFARIVEAHIKSNLTADFINTINGEVIDILRNQPGFKDEYTYALEETPDRVVAISIWETKADAAHYAKADFEKIKKLLGEFLVEPLQVRTARLVQSTTHKDLSAAA